MRRRSEQVGPPEGKLVLLLLAAIGAVSASLLVAPIQAPLVISDQPSCRACRIVVGPRQLSIGDTSASVPPLSGLVTSVAGGRFYLAGARAGAPLVFDAAGRFVRPLARTGAGPGEIRLATAIVTGPGDSVAVYDGGTGRVQVFDRDLRFARGFGLAQSVAHGGLLWRQGDEPFVASGLRPTPSDIGYTIHLYGGDGSHRRSVAESTAPIVPGDRSASAFAHLRLLQEMTRDRIISVSASAIGGYSIEVLDLASGLALHRWRRLSGDFEIEAGGPFPPRVTAARMDSTGRPWTLVTVRAPNWERGAKVVVIGSGRQVERGYQVVDRNLISDSVIEVIELQSGRLIARERFDRAYVALLPGGLLVAESDGGTGFELFPVELVERV